MASLEERIAQRMHDTLTRMAAAEFSVDTTRGLAYGGREGPVIAMTVEDVARVAAEVAAESAPEWRTE